MKRSFTLYNDFAHQLRISQQSVANQLRIIHKRIDSLPWHTHTGSGGNVWGVTFEYDNTTVPHQCTLTITVTKNSNPAAYYLVWYYFSTDPTPTGLATPIPVLTDSSGQFVSTVGDDMGEPIYLLVFDPDGERHLSDPITFNP